MNRPRPSYLAIDLGASSCRAILGTLRNGAMALKEIHRFTTPMVEESGHLYWDVDQIWQELCRALEQSHKEAAHLRSVSVDSWGVDYVPIDDQGRPVRRPFCYRDSRTGGMVELATSRVPAEVIYRATGTQFMPINTLYQVLADSELDASTYTRTRSRLLIGDFFNYRLSGRAVAEWSLASTTQALRAGRAEWARDLLEDLGLDQDGWPAIVASGTVLGALPDYPDVQVVAGCSHDTACAVAAAPVEPGDEHWAFLSCGTWSLLGVERSRPLLHDAAREAGFTNEVGLDGTIRFLKNMTGLWILQECERAWREAGEVVDHARLFQEAREKPAPEALLDVADPALAQRVHMPNLIGEMCRDRRMAAPDSRGAMVRLILESLAEGHRQTLRELERVTNTQIDTLYLLGGGAQNPLLCQYTANRCGCRVVAGPTEATALGNLLIQARTLGDLAEPLRRVVRRSSRLQVFKPEVDAHA